MWTSAIDGIVDDEDKGPIDVWHQSKTIQLDSRTNGENSTPPSDDFGCCADWRQGGKRDK